MDNQIPSRVLTATVSGVRLGFDVREIQEVIVFKGVHEVPAAPKAVLGLINLRGQILTAISVSAMLGISNKTKTSAPYGSKRSGNGEDTSTQMNLVLENEGDLFGLVVDHVSDVIDVEPSQAEACPTSVTEKVTKISRGVLKMPEEIILLLDAVGLVKMSNP